MVTGDIDPRRGVEAAPGPILELDARPVPLGRWIASLWGHRAILAALARQDFRSRYKRASLGLVWAIAVPIFQGSVLVFVFSRVGRFATDDFSYGTYVLAGMIAWFYVSTSVMSATTSIVDSSGLTEKVWFPRAVLALVPSATNLVGLVISTAVVLAAVPVLGGDYTLRLLLLLPGSALLIAFTAGMGLVLSAAYVYFRDVRFMVQAALLAWLYLTPIVYPPSALGNAAEWLDLNPLTGITGLLQRAVVDAPVPSGRAVAVSLGATLVLVVVGALLHRRHDRLFVDLL
jgi:ABC-type polysaccharide/polyol phosphate export permease